MSTHWLNQTSVSVNIEIVDAAGLPVTGLVASTFPAIKIASGAAADVTNSLNDLSSVTAAFTAWGVKERGEGVYRLDVPDTTCATSGVKVIRGYATGKVVVALRLSVAVVTAAQFGTLPTSGTVGVAGGDVNVVGIAGEDPVSWFSSTIPLVSVAGFSIEQIVGGVDAGPTGNNAAQAAAQATAVSSRLTAARAGYLDKLNVVGVLANTDNAATFRADVSGLLLAANYVAPDNAGIGNAVTAAEAAAAGASPTAVAEAVWTWAGAAGRKLTSFGTLVADIVTAVTAASMTLVDLTASIVNGIERAGGLLASLALPGGPGGTGDIVVDHNTGGANNLAAMRSDGSGIDDVAITAYVKSEYVAGIREPRDNTRTDTNGQWRKPMFLSANEYRFVYDKAGSPSAFVDWVVA